MSSKLLLLLQHLSAIISISIISMSFVEYHSLSDFLGPILPKTFTSLKQLRKIHIASQLVFTLVVWLGTVAEVIIFLFPNSIFNYDYHRFLEVVVPFLDNFVAVPSLAIATSSAVSMTRFSKRQIHPNIEKSMKILGFFGLFWVVCDRTTQAATTSTPAIFLIRLVINSVSCYLVYTLRRLMFEMRSKKKIN